MKTPEEMAEYFRSMPSIKKESNPYWDFDTENNGILAKFTIPHPDSDEMRKSLDLSHDTESMETLRKVREFFRRFYESFRSEAQVLCLTMEDADKLMEIGIPILTTGQIGPHEIAVMVLPQDNHMGTSVISEWFWQERIIAAGIKPVARIHSHHVLNPYQSFTDYSTLNSGTLEIVIGKIDHEELNICYWLDVPGTDIKSQTFVAREKEDGMFEVFPHVFNKRAVDKDPKDELSTDDSLLNAFRVCAEDL